MADIDGHRAPSDAVSLFRYGHRDNARAPISETCHEIFRRTAGRDDALDASNQPGAQVGCVALDQGVETILRIERIGKLDATQACAHDPPIAAGRRKRGISIVGLMGTVKRVDPEMDDAVAVSGRLVGRSKRHAGDVGKRRQALRRTHTDNPMDG